MSSRFDDLVTRLFRMSDETRQLRAAHRAARVELERVSDRDRCESDEYLAANAAVIDTEKTLPWWKRIDIDTTVG